MERWRSAVARETERWDGALETALRAAPADSEEASMLRHWLAHSLEAVYVPAPDGNQKVPQKPHIFHAAQSFSDSSFQKCLDIQQRASILNKEQSFRSAQQLHENQSTRKGTFLSDLQPGEWMGSLLGVWEEKEAVGEKLRLAVLPSTPLLSLPSEDVPPLTAKPPTLHWSEVLYFSHYSSIGLC